MVVANMNISCVSPELKDIINHAFIKLVSNKDIKISERNKKFLQFVIEESLCGRGDRIKAYTIGVDVFGRGENFDPNADPIVRIEATRLRSALAAYYRGPGKLDPVKILMRPGSYIPVFIGVPDTGLEVVARLASFSGATIIANHATDPRDRATFACGSLFTKSLVRKLNEERYRVFLAEANSINDSNPGSQPLENYDRAFRLEISVLPFADGRRYAWTVSDQRTGELCGIDDMDELSNALPNAETLCKFTTRAFSSIATIIGYYRA